MSSTKTVEILVSPSMTASIVTGLAQLEESNKSVVAYHTAQVKRFAKCATDDDKLLYEEWKRRADRITNNAELSDSIISKFTSATRPFKLSKVESKVLAEVVGGISIDFTAINPYSGLTNINHPDKFYGFPKLEASVRKKVQDIKDAFISLSRSDVSAIVK